MESPQEIPLFPLGLTLLPGGLIALKIFEFRYLDMVKRCLKDNRPFGVVPLFKGHDIDQPNQREVNFLPNGTLAKVIEFEAIQPALFMIRCLGTQRFKLEKPEMRAMGLWHAMIEEIEPDPYYPIPRELQKVAEQLDYQIRLAKKKGVRLEQLPFSEPYQFNDCGWVANRWCDLLDLSAGEKDVLMMQENPRIRLELISEILLEFGIVAE
jgi:Lon protease-like protein